MEETRIAMKTPTRWESGPRSIFPSDPIHLSYQEHLRQGCWTCIPAVVEKGLLPSVYKIGALQKSPGQCYKSRKRQEEVERVKTRLDYWTRLAVFIEGFLTSPSSSGRKSPSPQYPRLDLEEPMVRIFWSVWSPSAFSQVPGMNPDFGIAGIHGADGWEVEEKSPLNSNSETPR